MTEAEQFNEAVLICTGHPEWEIIKKGLSADIYQIQANSLEASSWDQVCENRGFARGLAYMVNLRENVQVAEAQAKANANL